MMNHATPRRRFRDGDSDGMKVLATMFRHRLVVAFLWTLLGGTATAVAMRFFLVTKLNAQDARLATVETRSIQTDKKTDSLRAGMLILTKSACLDRTSGEQALAGMDCPAELYKGVLQGVHRGAEP